jgi:hypothetical protein
MTATLQDKRSSMRRRMLKAGRISFNQGGSTIDCLLRNISRTGALLKVTTPLGIPDRFDLVLVEVSSCFLAELCGAGPKRLGWSSTTDADYVAFGLGGATTTSGVASS